MLSKSDFWPVHFSHAEVVKTTLNWPMRRSIPAFFKAWFLLRTSTVALKEMNLSNSLQTLTFSIQFQPEPGTDDTDKHFSHTSLEIWYIYIWYIYNIYIYILRTYPHIPHTYTIFCPYPIVQPDLSEGTSRNSSRVGHFFFFLGFSVVLYNL